jgi:hypothetical protein
MAIADNFECLYERNTGSQHRRELAAEYSDIAGRDPGLARKCTGTLFTYPARYHALAAEVGTYGGFRSSVR